MLWLSKGDILNSLAEMSHMVFVLVQNMKTQACGKKQKYRAETLFSAINRNDAKARIFYQPDIFTHINQLQYIKHCKGEMLLYWTVGRQYVHL